MAVAVLDTNVLFAGLSTRDEYHGPASEIVRGIDHGDLPEAIVTEYVVAEALNLVRERLGPDAANGLLDRLVEGAHFEITHVPQADFTAAQGFSVGTRHCRSSMRRSSHTSGERTASSSTRSTVTSMPSRA